MHGENEIKWIVLEAYSPITSKVYPNISTRNLQDNIAVYHQMLIQCKKRGDLTTVNITINYVELKG
jgi:hypothetical protein